MVSLNEQLSSGSITEENFKKERDKINSKRNNLNIGISRKTVRGYKLLARKGRIVQEIYIITESFHNL